MKGSFRQSMTWLHTWSSLIVIWLLFAVFVTGTLAFYRNEITHWMQPEGHAGGASDRAGVIERAWGALSERAPAAESWSISLPNERAPQVGLSWTDAGQARERRRGPMVQLDAASGEELTLRETAGGNFLYRFHFELYAMPRDVGRAIVGFASMLMLIAIISGVIMHRKIFTDFFTFRPGTRSVSWIDGHVIGGVVALPFHIMITFSGLLLLSSTLLFWNGGGERGGPPQGGGNGHADEMHSAEKQRGFGAGDSRTFQGGSERGMTGGAERGMNGGAERGMNGGAERGMNGGAERGMNGGAERGMNGGAERGMNGGSERGMNGGSERGMNGGSERGMNGGNPSSGSEPQASMPDLVAMLIAAEQEWNAEVSTITINNPLRGATTVSVSTAERETLTSGKSGRQLTFNLQGEVIERRGESSQNTSVAGIVYSVLDMVHQARFADSLTRLLFFLSGVLGSLMVAGGAVLWSVKRARQQSGQPGYELVGALNLAAVGGLMVAVAAYFWGNRLIPASLPDREVWEVRVFFSIWALALAHAALARQYHGWLIQLGLASALLLLLPVLDALTSPVGLMSAMTAADWPRLGVDVLALLIGAGLLFAAIRVYQFGNKNKSSAAVRGARMREGNV